MNKKKKWLKNKEQQAGIPTVSKEALGLLQVSIINNQLKIDSHQNISLIRRLFYKINQNIDLRLRIKNKILILIKNHRKNRIKIF